jgi:PmbA protein
VEWIDQILREGEKLAAEVEIYQTWGDGLSLELRRRIVSVATESRWCGLGIRTIVNGKIGVSGTNDPARWRECLEASLAAGRLVTPQEWKGLPGPAAIRRTAPSVDTALSPDPVLAQKLLERMIDGAAEHPAQVTAGGVNLSRGGMLIANNHGLFYRQHRTHVSVSLEAIAGQSTGYEFASSSFLDVDPHWVGEQAAFFASHSAHGTDVPSGEYDVLLAPTAVAQLVGSVIGPALSGRNVHAGRSRLKGLLGTACMDTRIGIFDDPFARGLGATPWDAEGMPTAKVDFVREGVLERFAYDLRTAYRFGAQSTASAVRNGHGGAPSIGFHNLILDGPRAKVGDERCLYVHDVVGAHTANPASGDFSVEISNPIWMADGEYQAPVRKAMLAGNVFSMLASIGGIGEGSRIIGSSIMPPVRLTSQHVIGA